MSVKDISPINASGLYQIFTENSQITNFDEIYSRLIDKRREMKVQGKPPAEETVGADLILLIADESLKSGPEGWELTQRGERQLEALAPAMA